MQTIKRLWSWFWSPTTRFSLGGILIIGMVFGILLWGGFNWGLELSNTEEFCTSCHEMRDNVFMESKSRVHYMNEVGVNAICSDCHVPHNWFKKMWRKMKASNEVYNKILGTIGTREKFLAHRKELAEEVWATMKANDSEACRSCHKVDRMDLDKQKRRARVEHQNMAANGQTCIDCHKGIAHDEVKEAMTEEKSEDNADFTL